MSQSDVQMAISAEMPTVTAEVEINGSAYDWLTCTHIEDSVGILPSRAKIRIGGKAADVTGPITLNAVQWPFKYGSRVRITLNSTGILFLGQLVKRQDIGGEESIVWEAWDDRWLLMQIPVRGCLVRDSYSGLVQFLPRYECRTNPHGYWNCCGAKIGNNVYPVFTERAEMGKLYESPDETFNDSLEDGKLTAWTPRRFLQYLRLIANLDASSGIVGITAQNWRSIKNSQRIVWTTQSLNIFGSDLAQKGVDPLDKKHPDFKYQGKRMLGAIVDCLEIAGTHGLYLNLNNNEQSAVAFYPERKSNKIMVSPTDGTVIPLVRGGSAVDINTGYDFELEEDASKIAESVLVEAAPVLTEIPMTWTGTESNSVLKPAWTHPAGFASCNIVSGQTEHEAALAVVFGNNSESKDGSGNPLAVHAWYPDIQNSTDRSCFKYADGQGGRPLALVNTNEAMNLMRKCFPRVFAAWYLDTNVAQQQGLLAGFDNRYSSSPLNLGGVRQILHEQLQFYVKDPTGNGSVTNGVKSTFPIRIQVGGTVGGDVNQGGTNWHDVAENSGLRVEGDGFIYFDGLVENIDSNNDCLYSNSLLTKPSWPTLPNDVAATIVPKTLRINAACPLDVRVTGYKEIDKGNSDLDAALFADLGGPFELYIDSSGHTPETGAYFEKHQVKSQPSPATQYYTGTDGTQLTPSGQTLTRLLPPGTEQPHADYAAQRRLAASQYLHRRSSWKMIGIRPEYTVGMWIDKVKIVNGAQGDADYDLSSPIRTRTMVFVGRQETALGGLISQLTQNKVAPNQSKKTVAPEPTYRARSTGNAYRPSAEARSVAPVGAGENDAVTPGAHNYDTD